MKYITLHSLLHASPNNDKKFRFPFKSFATVCVLCSCLVGGGGGVAAMRRSGHPHTPPGTRPARSQNAPPECRRCSAADLNICDRSDTSPCLILPFSLSAPFLLYTYCKVAPEGGDGSLYSCIL
jgi:hypothetical protein